MRVGAPLALANGLESVAFAVVTFFAGRMGAKELAAFSDALNLNAWMFMMAIGIATATSVRVATAVGRGDQGALRRAGWVGAGIRRHHRPVRQLIIAGSGEHCSHLYQRSRGADDPDRRVAAGCLGFHRRWAADRALGSDPGRGRPVVPTLLQAISFWAVMVRLCYYLSTVAKMGVQGLFAGIGIAVLVASAMLAVRFYLFTRRVVLPV